MAPRPVSSRVVFADRAGPARARGLALAICIAAAAATCSGCLVTPRQPESAAPARPPQIPEGASSPEVAAQIQSSAPTTDFKATATDRQSFQVHIDFGRVFESQGDLDAAVLEYQEALTVAETKRRGSLGPADGALAHRRMGGALDRLGRFAQAEAHYQKALKYSPKDAKIWNDVGYSYYLQGRWADAERALKTAAKLAPDDERIRINLGLTLAAAGKTAEALPLLSQTTGDAAGHANLGYLLAATGQLDLARHQYETALAQRPDMELARRALERLDRQQNPVMPNQTNGLLAERKRTVGERLDREVEPVAVSSATIPPARNLSVQPVAAPKAKIPPPRTWSLPPASAAPAALVNPRGTQPGRTDVINDSSLPPVPPV
jgi:Flp pilus assembly protein TadD